MKFSFNETQLSYLKDTVGKLVVVVRKPDTEPKLYRTACKMRHKFSPNSLYVNLTISERELLSNMLTYRLQQLIDSKLPTNELPLVSDLLDVITGV